MTTDPVRPKIVLVGGAHLDRVARSGVSFVPRASNPGRSRESVGGAAFNAARALARFGAQTHLVSARGGDGIGIAVESALESEGIGDGSLTWLDRRSASYTAILDETGELRAAIADMEIYDLLSPRSFRRSHLRDKLASADAWILDANLPDVSLAHFAGAASGRPVFGIAVSPVKVLRFRACLPALSALFLSRTEAASLLGLSKDTPLPDLAEGLFSAGLRRAAITDGPNPALILDGSARHLQSTPQISSIRDVTGAGDTLAAGAAFELLHGADFVSAVRVGMAASSFHIEAELPVDSLLRCRLRAASLPPATPLA
ncbi:PfkB family carbohydrate kinase [Aureimonas sp. AU20]|uniref:PfkB family carbohydrate kinase n=1 Tax=Aureimonas sp. AU20 TaxID=1349819 RepID=UPI000721488A|nr:PfkB family carbohydrate kinase [Aureimonas sp. AU20]ALN73132.1 hypothetical protein M673_10400 [Aureimonas sp. AU20]